MKLHELKSKTKSKREKRVGRGGKRGTFSGRGTKGQKARSGRRIRPAERDLIQRLPKLRGFGNKPLKAKPVIFNIAELDKKMKSNNISLKSLVEAGLIKETDRRVKILSKGEIKKPFQVEGLEVSEQAKKKIESAGGKVIK